MPTPAASIGKLGTVDIYISPKDGDSTVREPVIPKILPIGAVITTLHYFGDPGQMRRVKGFVYGESAKASLETYAKNGTTINFTNDKGSQGNFVILALSFSRQNALNYTDTWYAAQLELLNQ